MRSLDVLAADVWSAPGRGEGMAVDVFVLEPRTGDPPDWARFQRDLSRSLRGELELDAQLADRASAYSHGRSQARLAIGYRVLVDNEASADATVVEVRGPNVVGVLYRIATALASCDLDIRHAKVLTLGFEIVDSFYVVDSDGQQLANARIDELERSVLRELAALVEAT